MKAFLHRARPKPSGEERRQYLSWNDLVIYYEEKEKFIRCSLFMVSTRVREKNKLRSSRFYFSHCQMFGFLQLQSCWASWQPGGIVKGACCTKSYPSLLVSVGFTMVLLSCFHLWQFVCWDVSRITQELQNRFPRTLDGSQPERIQITEHIIFDIFGKLLRE